MVIKELTLERCNEQEGESLLKRRSPGKLIRELGADFTRLFVPSVGCTMDAGASIATLCCGSTRQRIQPESYFADT
jgi:hypothetical protein